eukprot:12198054-Alexandrium_andersonii.AAC.1
MLQGSHDISVREFLSLHCGTPTDSPSAVASPAALATGHSGSSSNGAIGHPRPLVEADAHVEEGAAPVGAVAE